MSRRPKLIATDLDGTIVQHNGTISTRTIDVFTRAHAMGIHIFFVTGRPPRWMDEIRDAFGFGSAICANGAMLYDLQTGTVTQEWMISQEDQIEIAHRLRPAMPGVSFAVEAHDYYYREKSYIPRWDVGLDNVGVLKIEDVIKDPALKMLARCSGGELTSDQMLAIATRELDGLATVTHSNSRDSLLEISALGISKGATLSVVASRLNIDASECVSFGDNPNDFSMLRWCGRSFAMADGHPEGLSHASGIASACADDGVAEILEKLLELPA
ncbi:MAG: haloacid dehalogenase [Actinobacteria bacterium]|nr:MAG: haloacid dehalogenase [Actinomycetota bacterium]